MTKANRAAILAHTHAETIRISRNAEVHAWGIIPNTNQTGWYLVGYVDYILDEIAYYAEHLAERQHDMDLIK